VKYSRTNSEICIIFLNPTANTDTMWISWNTLPSFI